MKNNLIKNRAVKNQSSDREVAEQMKKLIPLGRFATPEELAYMVVFLSSEYAGYINGIKINLVDMWLIGIATIKMII